MPAYRDWTTLIVCLVLVVLVSTLSVTIHWPWQEQAQCYVDAIAMSGFMIAAGDAMVTWNGGGRVQKP